MLLIKENFNMENKILNFNGEKKEILNKLKNKTKILNKLVLHKKHDCKPCERLNKIWPQLMKYINDKKFNLKIIEKYKTQTDGVLTYPTIKLYLKDGQMIIYDKDRFPRTIENLKKFINKYNLYLQ